MCVGGVNTRFSGNFYRKRGGGVEICQVPLGARGTVIRTQLYKRSRFARRAKGFHTLSPGTVACSRPAFDVRTNPSLSIAPTCTRTTYTYTYRGIPKKSASIMREPKLSPSLYPPSPVSRDGLNDDGVAKPHRAARDTAARLRMPRHSACRSARAPSSAAP